MTTFDLPTVRAFATDLHARIDRCDNGEGMECANLDATLRTYARVCCEYRESVRAWGRAVFKGEVGFDPDVERELYDAGLGLVARAFSLLCHVGDAEGPCYQLDGPNQLRAAIADLDQLLIPWATPTRSVGPAGRVPVPPGSVPEARRRLGELPGLPADWEPADPQQRRLLRLLRGFSAQAGRPT